MAANMDEIYKQNLANKDKIMQTMTNSLKVNGQTPTNTTVSYNGTAYTPAPVKPTAPTVPQVNPFQAPTYNYMTYDQAKGQAGDRLNPEYAMKLQEALTNVKNQAMGSGFYGQLPTVQYSADTSGQIEAQKQSAIAQLAQSLQDADYQKGEREYDKAFNLWGANNDITYKNYDLAHQDYRDQVGDNQWQTQFDYGKSQDSLANSWKARDWQHGLDREKIDDNRYADETAYKRKMDAIQLARSRSGGGGGGRRSSGGSRGGSASGHYDEQQIGAEYINTVLGTRSNKANAQEQFNRDKASLAALGMSPKEIAYIQKQLDGYKDDWVGPGYNSKNAPKNPLAGFWGTFNPKYKYVK